MRPLHFSSTATAGSSAFVKGEKSIIRGEKSIIRLSFIATFTIPYPLHSPPPDSIYLYLKSAKYAAVWIWWGLRLEERSDEILFFIQVQQWENIWSKETTKMLYGEDMLYVDRSKEKEQNVSCYILFIFLRIFLSTHKGNGESSKHKWITICY